MLSWLAGCVVVGWVLIYNALRIGGATPSEAAWPSLAAGAAVGAVVFGGALLLRRRLAASGRVLRSGPGRHPLALRAGRLPSATRCASPGRRWLRWRSWRWRSAPTCAVGLVSPTPACRAKTTIDPRRRGTCCVGLWLGDEALRLPARRGRRHRVDRARVHPHRRPRGGRPVARPGRAGAGRPDRARPRSRARSSPSPSGGCRARAACPSRRWAS